ASRAVAHAKLLRVAALLFFYESDATQIGAHARAARTKKQIAAGNVCGLAPENRSAAQWLVLILLWLAQARVDRSDQREHHQQCDAHLLCRIHHSTPGVLNLLVGTGALDKVFLTVEGFGVTLNGNV